MGRRFEQGSAERDALEQAIFNPAKRVTSKELEFMARWSFKTALMCDAALRNAHLRVDPGWEPRWGSDVSKEFRQIGVPASDCSIWLGAIHFEDHDVPNSTQASREVVDLTEIEHLGLPALRPTINALEVVGLMRLQIVVREPMGSEGLRNIVDTHVDALPGLHRVWPSRSSGVDLPPGGRVLPGDASNVLSRLVVWNPMATTELVAVLHAGDRTWHLTTPSGPRGQGVDGPPIAKTVS